jgi:hypothetical protein
VALDVEHAREGWIEVVVKLFGNAKAWCDNERASCLESEWSESNASGLAATDREDDSDLTILGVRIGGELGQLRICFPLGYTEAVVIDDLGLAGLKGIVLHSFYLE